MELYEDPKLSKYKSKLKKMRIRRGFTQKELSEASDVNIKSIAAFEQDPKKLIVASTITTLRLAETLNCEIEDLLNKEDIK